MDVQEKLFVSLELAQLAKEKGYSGAYFAYFCGKTFNFFGDDRLLDTHGVDIECPTYQELINWFREEHCIHICPKHHITSQTYGYIITGKYDKDILERLVDYSLGKMEYYEMLNHAIKQAFLFI